MGSDVVVIWSGDRASSTDLSTRTVALDYGPLQGRSCPFPGAAVDAVIGYAAHEGGHCLWSANGKGAASRDAVKGAWQTLPEAFRRDWLSDETRTLAELARIQNVLEDAHVDCLVARTWPVLGEYIRIARNRLRERVSIDLGAIARETRPDRNSAINLWLSISLYGVALPSGASREVTTAMDALLALCRRSASEDAPAARHALAIPAAAILWALSPEGPAAAPSVSAEGATGGTERESSPGAGALDDFDTVADVGRHGHNPVGVPQVMLDAMRDRREGGQTQDLSQPVARTLSSDPRETIATARRGEYECRAVSVERSVARETEEVRRAFQRFTNVSSGWARQGARTVGRKAAVETAELDGKRIPQRDHRGGARAGAQDRGAPYQQHLQQAQQRPRQLQARPRSRSQALPQGHRPAHG